MAINELNIITEMKGIRISPKDESSSTKSESFLHNP